MKKIFLLFAFLGLISFASAQSGTTCVNAITVTSTLQPPIYAAVANQTTWYEFTPDSTNVLIGASIIYDSTNLNNHLFKMEVYSGTCSSMTLLYTQTAVDSTQKTLVVNAVGLSPTQVYYIKIYNSNIATNYSILLENRTDMLTACTNKLSNGGFEGHSALPSCSSPTASFSVTLASSWGAYQSPDYLNTASGTLTACLSFTPSPHSGNAHGGFAIGHPTIPTYKEYILNSVATTPGTTYQIIFYYKTAQGGSVAPQVGVAASAGSISLPSSSALPKTETPDINGYTKVTSYYTATGSIMHIAIGSFTSATATSLQYYYIDDASIIEVPTATVSGPTTFCSADVVHITLTAGGGSGFSWTSSPALTGFPATGGTASINSPLPPETVNTVYTITLAGTTPSGCTSTTTIPITVLVSPFAATISGLHTFCGTAGVTLHASTSFSSTIQWFLNGVAIPGASGSAYTNYTATTAGIYTVQISYVGGGCPVMSAPFTVTAYPLPTVTVVSSVPESCPGSSDGQATATVSTATAPLTYSWTNGTVHTTSVFTDNVTGLPGGYIDLTVTDAHGCSITPPGATVTTNPLFVGPIIPGDGTICNYATPVTYSISNYSSTYTYSTPVISPAGYGTPSAVSGTGTFTVLWTLSAYTSGATISITATNAANHCAATGTVTMQGCCLGPAGTVNIVDGVSSSLTNPFVSGTLVVNGTLTIDNNFTINASDVVMAPGAKIVIPTGGLAKTLTLNSTHVYSDFCKYMWNSIYVNAGQTLIVGNSSRIEDADSAIVSIGGGKYTISNSELNQNYKHIVVMPYNGTHPGTVVKTNFYCRNYPSMGNAPLLSPYAPGTRTSVGIEIWGITNITVGANTILTDHNLFQNMDFGIRSSKSNLTANNNSFIGINNPSGATCSTCGCDIGTAICSNGGTTRSRSLLVAAGTGTGVKNYFQDGVNGVVAKTNQDVFVDGNSFTNMTGTGVYVAYCTSRLLDVSTNDMNIVTNGIDMYEDPNPTSMNITSNNINLSVGHATGTVANYGIVVQNVMLNPNNATISTNTIMRAKTGIWLINSDGTNVQDNPISYPSSIVVAGATLIGIRLEGSNNCIVQGNSVSQTGVATASIVTVLRGISVENTQNTSIGKNTLTALGQGIRMLAACNNATIACNTMAQCWFGLKFDGAAVGDQLGSTVAQRNLWVTNAGPTKMSGTITSSIKFWYTTGSTNEDPYVGGVTGLTALSFVTGHPATTTNATDVCGSFNLVAPGGGEAARNAKYGSIVRGTTSYTATPAEFTASDKEMAYGELEKDTTQLNLGEPDDYVFQNFYHNVKGSPVGRFKQVNRLINNNRIPAAITLNNAVTPTTVMETNRQIVNNIYLQTFANGNYNLEPADVSTLQSIAYLDPLTNGDAVYSARSMLRIDPSDLPTRSLSADAPESITDHKTASKVYPNPNNGVMQLDYTIADQQTGSMIIYDMTGRKLSSYVLISGTNTLQIDESKLAGGIYFYQIIVNNHLVQADKIIIVK